MLTEIDDSSDPIPSTRYTVRVRGDHIEAAPKVSNKLVNRTRRWMIRDEWLKNDQNKKFDVPSCIAESGKAWGDEDDPEELEAKAQQFKVEKNEVVQKNKAKSVKKQKLKVEGEASKAQKKADNDAEKELKRAAKEAKKKAKENVEMAIDLQLRGMDSGDDVVMDDDAFFS